MGINNSIVNNNLNSIKLNNFSEEALRFKEKNLIFILNEEILLFLNYNPVINTMVHEDFDDNNENSE